MEKQLAFTVTMILSCAYAAEIAPDKGTRLRSPPARLASQHMAGPRNKIIGNKFAPNINRLARDYGLATHSFSTADSSAPNYVAMLGGSDFGIADDNGYYLHTVDSPSLTTQLDDAGLNWPARRGHSRRR